MYHRIFIFLFLVFFSIDTAFSQVRFSPKFGFNFSNLNVEADSIATDGSNGWNLGLDLRIEDERLFFHPGLHYQQVKVDLTKFEQLMPPGELTENARINYIKIPLNVGYYITGQGSLLRIHVRGGIIPQFVVSATEREAFNFNQDQLNSFAWGANGAIGLDFILLTLEFSYEFGLTNFYQDNSGKNSLAVLRFGFIF